MVIAESYKLELIESFGEGYPSDKQSRESYGLILQLGRTSRVELYWRTYFGHAGVLLFLREGERYRITLEEYHLKCYVPNFRVSETADWFIPDG